MLLETDGTPFVSFELCLRILLGFGAGLVPASEDEEGGLAAAADGAGTGLDMRLKTSAMRMLISAAESSSSPSPAPNHAHVKPAVQQSSLLHWLRMN